MPLLYPAASPTLVADVLTINRFLESPADVSRRLRTLAEQRFISDALLTATLPVSGGALMFETDEGIYSDRAIAAVAPGSEYPLTTISTGAASLASVVKWGQDTLVTDEAITRQRRDAVETAMVKMVNQLVRHVDTISLSAIASAVTASEAAAAPWATATAEQIITDIVVRGVAPIRALNQGYEPDTVVVDDVRWGYAMSKFIAAGLTPRESATSPLLTGEYPTILGMRWLATPNLPTTGQALVLDSRNLGGMADENLIGPGYVGEGAAGVQGKAMREDKNDRWRLRARRVTVPVVQNPGAARKITGVGA